MLRSTAVGGTCLVLGALAVLLSPSTAEAQCYGGSGVYVQASAGYATGGRTVYVQRPVYVQQPVYVQKPVYVRPPTCRTRTVYVRPAPTRQVVYYSKPHRSSRVIYHSGHRPHYRSHVIRSTPHRTVYRSRPVAHHRRSHHHRHGRGISVGVRW